MEYALMAVTPEQNTRHNGYGAHGDADADHKEELEARPLSLDQELDGQAFMQGVDARSDRKHAKLIWRAFERFYGRSHFPLYEEAQAQAQQQPSSARYYEKSGWGHNHPLLDEQ